MKWIQTKPCSHIMRKSSMKRKRKGRKKRNKTVWPYMHSHLIQANERKHPKQAISTTGANSQCLIKQPTAAPWQESYYYRTHQHKSSSQLRVSILSHSIPVPFPSQSRFHSILCHKIWPRISPWLSMRRDCSPAVLRITPWIYQSARITIKKKKR